FDCLFQPEAAISTRSWVAMSRARLALEDRAWAEAADHARLAVQLADEAGERLLRLGARALLIVVGWLLGDSPSMRPVAEEMVDLATEPPDVARALRMLADIDAARGRLDLAVDSLQRALQVVGEAPEHAAVRADLTTRLGQIRALATTAAPPAARGRGAPDG